jgi:tetratricopeptide (TPR) repeat protein
MTTDDVEFKNLCYDMCGNTYLTVDEIICIIDDEKLICNKNNYNMQVNLILLKDNFCELMCLGNIYFYDEKYKDAIEYYKIILDKNISKKINSYSMNNIALCNMKFEKRDESINLLKECIEKYSCIFALYNLSIIYFITKDIPRFIRYMEIVIKKGFSPPCNVIFKYYDGIFSNTETQIENT